MVRYLFPLFQVDRLVRILYIYSAGFPIVGASLHLLPTLFSLRIFNSFILIPAFDTSEIILAAILYH